MNYLLAHGRNAALKNKVLGLYCEAASLLPLMSEESRRKQG